MAVNGLWALENLARKFYPEHDGLLSWFEDTTLTRELMEGSRRNPFYTRHGVSAEQADALMHDLYLKLGSLNNLGCLALKEKMVESEYSGTGRVSVAKF